MQTYQKKVLQHISDAKILLFGSRAQQTNLHTSDYDIIIISKTFAHMPFPRRLEQVYQWWDDCYNADILPYTPQEIEQRKNSLTIVGKALQQAISIPKI
ncbi:MAG: nucleotidyltransferase domain-containing protein [Candidatus Woesearchaeota archaeon]